jgi:hypothetical protein
MGLCVAFTVTRNENDIHDLYCWRNEALRWRSRLRHCATIRKVAGSIPNVDTGIFHWHNPNGRTKALWSTKPLTEMSTRNISGGKGGQCVRLTAFLPSCVDCLKIWELQTLGISGPVQACNGIPLPFYSLLKVDKIRVVWTEGTTWKT